MYSDLLSQVRTKEESSKLIDELEVVFEALFTNRVEALEEALTQRVSAKTSAILKDAFAKGVDKEAYLKGARLALKNLRVISITCAFAPRDSTLTKLSAWVRKNVGEGVVIDISKDEGVVAGAVIISRGNFRDFSLRKKIREFMKNERKVLISSFGQ